MVKLGGGKNRSPRGKHSAGGNKFGSPWKRGKSAGVAGTDRNAIATTATEESTHSIKTELGTFVQPTSNQGKNTKAATPTAKKKPTTPLENNLAPPVVMTQKSQSIKSMLSLKSRNKSGKSKSKDKSAAIPEEVPIPVLVPAVDAASPSRGDLSAKKRYVPLQQRLKEEEFRMQAEKDAKAAAVRRKKGCGKVNDNKESGTMANCCEDDMKKILPEFSELDRVCSPIERECAPCTGYDDEGSFLVGSDEELVLNLPVQGKKNEGNVNNETETYSWSPGAWLLSDLIRSPIDKLDQLISNSTDACSCLRIDCTSMATSKDDRTVQSDPPPVAKYGRPFLQVDTSQSQSQSQEDSPTSAALFARVATAESFPPATSEKKTRAAVNGKRAEKQVVEQVKARAAEQARMEGQRALEDAWALAAEEAKRAREKADMKITEYTDELKWMEANLDYESQQNSALNVQVAQLKHDIIANKGQLKKDVSIAHNKAQKAVDDRNDEIKKMEQAITTLKENIEQERKLKSEQNSALNVQVAQLKQDIITAKVQLKKDMSITHNKAQKAVDARNDEMQKMEQAITTLKENIEQERKLKDDAMQIAQCDAQNTIEARNYDTKKMEEVIATLRLGIKTEQRHRDEAMQSAQADAQNIIEARKYEIKQMEEVIATLRLNIKTERMHREDAEKIVQDKEEKTERNNEIQCKALRNIKANLKAENLQNLALNAEVAELNSEILVAKAKQQAMNEVNACLAEEVGAAKEAAELKINAQTEALKKMEVNWKMESKQNAGLNAHIAQLKKDIGAARAKQEALDEEAKTVKEVAESKILTQTESLRKVESKLKLESKQNNVLDARIAQLNKSIFAAQGKQEALDKEACRVKKNAEVRINAQTEALEKMEVNWNSESKENSVLTAQIAQLKKDIVDAKAEQEAVDLARARSAEGALKAREQAEDKTNAQSDELKKMEDKLNSESKTNSDLHAQMTLLKSDNEQLKRLRSTDRKGARKTIEAQNEELKKVAQLKSDNAQLKKVMTTDRKGAQKTIDAQNEELKKVAQLKSDNAQLKRVMSTDRKDAQKTIDAQNEELKKVSQLKSENAQLKRVMSTDRKGAQKTIDAQNEELKRVENAILKLKANIAREYKLREEAVESKSGAEVALQKKIDLISQEILVAQKKYAEKVEIVQSMSVDSTHPKTTYNDDENAVEVAFNGEAEETLADLEEDEPEELEEEEENSTASEEGDKLGDLSLAGDEAELYGNTSFISVASSATTARGGKKVGWFRKLLSNGSNADVDITMASSAVSEYTRGKRAGWRRSKNRRTRMDSVISEDSMEDHDEDEFAEESAYDEDTYASPNASQSYSMSYSQSFESFKAVESDCTSASGGTILSASEAAPEKSPKTGGKGGGSSSRGIEWPIFESLQKTASSGSEQTDFTSSSETQSTATGSADQEASAMGGIASWFGSAMNNGKQGGKVSLARVNSGALILVQ